MNPFLILIEFCFWGFIAFEYITLLVCAVKNWRRRRWVGVAVVLILVAQTLLWIRANRILSTIDFG